MILGLRTFYWIHWVSSFMVFMKVMDIKKRRQITCMEIILEIFQNLYPTLTNMYPEYIPDPI